MVGILRTQKDIDRARQRADELKQQVKQLKREIRASSGRITGQAERLCGRTVLHLLRQGKPLSAEAIATQARAMAGQADRDALDLLVEQLNSMPARGEGSRDVTLDPGVRFALGENQRATKRAEPVGYAEAPLVPVVGGDFSKASPDAHQAHLLSLIEAEGPIDRELIYTRIRQSWGLPQAHPALKKAIDACLDALSSEARIRGDEASHWSVGCEVRPRKRSKQFRETYSSDLVPAIELQAAIVQCLLRGEGTTDDIIAAVCEMIGYEATSFALKTRVRRGIVALYSSGDVVAIRR